MPIHDHPEKTEGSFPTESEQTLETALEERNALGLLLSVMSNEEERHQDCDDYLHGRHPLPYMPKEASSEYRLLAERATTNMMPLVIGNLVQMLFVEGYGEGGQNTDLWRAWQFNRMDARQSAIYAGALTFGASYAVVSRGTKPLAGPLPKVRGVSARNMTAVYADPANDEFPVWALEHVKGRRYRLFGDTDILTLELTTDRSDREPRFREISREPHGGPPGVCPVVRYTYALDLEGRYHGEIEPLMRVQDRLNQTVMDRLLVQTFGSFKVRVFTGMESQKRMTDDEANANRLRMSVSRAITIEDEGVKASTLPETSMDGFISAGQRDQETISAMSSVPPHYLTGELNNLGAEAIAEARASLDAKVDLLKHSFGESNELVFRLMAWFIDDSAGWESFETQVVWHDHQNRSMSQMADALGKIASQLEVPVEELWERIPGVSKTTADSWRKLREEEDTSALLAELTRSGGVTDADTGEHNPDAPEVSPAGGAVGGSQAEPTAVVGNV